MTSYYFSERTKIIISLFLAAFLFFQHLSPVFSNVEDEIAERTRQIQELQRQIAEYQKQVDSNRAQSSSLQNEILKLNAEISQINLEIRSLQLSIGETTLKIGSTETKIYDAEQELEKHRNALVQFMRLAYQNDQTSLTAILLKHDSLSDFFDEINNVEATQANLKATIDNIKSLKEDLSLQKTELEDKKIELEQLRSLEEIERRGLNSSKAIKDNLLKVTKGEESKYQELVQKSKQDIEKIRSQIFYLQQNGISAEEAVKFGQLAAIATGIRPAYLIAVLEIESGLGRNVGKCNRAEDPPERGYRNIMKPDRDIQPFLLVTAELGLDPETTAVSCPQYVNGQRYGWGGAMGPAQFIPSTWMGYKEEVSKIVGRLANPWNIEDAFAAAAVKLARGGAGAQTAASEIAASKAYYSGNLKCSSAPCNSYANAIQRKAAEIEPNL